MATIYSEDVLHYLREMVIAGVNDWGDCVYCDDVAGACESMPAGCVRGNTFQYLKKKGWI